jgi:serine/threonine protein kinase
MGADAEGGRVGEVLADRYELRAYVESGALGDIYKAVDRRLEYRQVAVKLLKAGTPDDQVARFKREALLTGGLSSPHVVKTSDFGQTADGRAYLVMEWLQGESLADLLYREERLPLERAMRLADGVLAGLEAAHEAGVVHRDLKPENLFVVAEPGVHDHVKILDFGFARVFGSSALDVTGEERIVVGTVSYMAPEQLRGCRADHRADLFSIAALLFRMASGRLPYDTRGPDATIASSAAFRALNLHKPPLRLDALDEAFEGLGALADVLERNLSVDVEQREASAGSMRRALALAVGDAAHLPVEASRPGESVEVWSNPASGVHRLAALDEDTAADPLGETVEVGSVDALVPEAPPSSAVAAAEPVAAGPSAEEAPAAPTPVGSASSLRGAIVGGVIFFVAVVAYFTWRALG